jgi:WD40 repeat protein
LEMKLWDLETGKAIRRVYEKDHRGKHDAASPKPFVTFSSDGTLIAFTSKDRHVTVRKVTDWSELQSLNIRNVPSIGVFSPDQKLLAIGTHNHGWALLYDLDSGKRVRIVSSLTGTSTQQVSFSDDGQLIYVVYGVFGGYVFCQDTDATDSAHPDRDTIWSWHRSELPRLKRPFPVSYSVRNHLLALRHPDLLTLYDIDTKKNRATIDDSKGLVVFSPDGKILVTSNEAGKTVLWAIPTK